MVWSGQTDERASVGEHRPFRGTLRQCSPKLTRCRVCLAGSEGRSQGPLSELMAAALQREKPGWRRGGRDTTEGDSTGQEESQDVATGRDTEQGPWRGPPGNSSNVRAFKTRTVLWVRGRLPALPWGVRLGAENPGEQKAEVRVGAGSGGKAARCEGPRKLPFP